MDPSALYAAIGAGHAVRGMCPTKEREGYIYVYISEQTECDAGRTADADPVP